MKLNNTEKKLFFKAGEVAKKTGIHVETLRFYEKHKVLPLPKRDKNDYRIYPLSTIERILFIRSAQNSGFKLREIQYLLELQRLGGENCNEVRNQVANKITEVEARIDDLLKIKSSLKGILKDCNGSDPIQSCSILEHFSAHKEGLS